MTICDAQYQMPAIFALTLSTIWAITVRIAITASELYNGTNNSAILPSIQAVHPAVFQLSCFNNSLNSAITQFHPPQKTDTYLIYLAFKWQKRWSDRVYGFKVKRGCSFCAENILRQLTLGLFPVIKVAKIGEESREGKGKKATTEEEGERKYLPPDRTSQEVQPQQKHMQKRFDYADTKECWEHEQLAWSHRGSWESSDLSNAVCNFWYVSTLYVCVRVCVY